MTCKIKASDMSSPFGEDNWKVNRCAGLCLQDGTSEKRLLCARVSQGWEMDTYVLRILESFLEKVGIPGGSDGK